MIAKLYDQSEIFITGGSGVLGKSAIEKLLRSCDVKFIYVLLRSKKDKNAQLRLEELKNSKIFRLLKEQKPNELDKLVAISGDTTEDGFNISSEDQIKLKNVSVFFHSAASTRFDLSLRSAIQCNVKSTLEALKLAETFKNLKIFLHISTLFCNPFVKHLKPEIYPAVFDWKISLKLLDSSFNEADATLAPITEKVIRGFPNTYVFTKHLSEQLVNEYRSKLPVAIFRPSIIVAASEEPEPGFSDTVTGVMGLFAIWGTGLIQVLLGSREIVLDFSPLDYCSKMLLIFTANVAMLKRENIAEKLPICLCSSRGLLDHSLGKISKMTSQLVKEHPNQKAFWIPHLTLTENPLVNWIYTFFLQLVPSAILDGLMILFQQKPIFMKIQRKIFNNAQALRYFLFNGVISDGPTDFDKYVEQSKGTVLDIGIFATCCKTDAGMHNTLKNVVKGSRKFLLNEDDSLEPRSRNILKVKMLLYNIFRLYVVYLIGRYIYRRVINYLDL